MNYTAFIDDETPPRPPVNGIDYDSSVGGALQAGFDYRIDDHWGFNVDVRRIWINTDVEVKSTGAKVGEVDIDPWVFGIGVRYRF